MTTDRHEHSGGTSVAKKRFPWTNFYEAVADKLLLYRDRRDELVEAIHSIAAKVKGLSNLQDQFQDGSKGPLKDICPFTAMGIFNRGITEANRKRIAAELATFLGVEEVVPDSFEGVPILNNQKSWFFGFEHIRQPDDIDVLWDIFAQAIAFSDSNADRDEVEKDFISAYDRAKEVSGVAWNLTLGLYWVRPWNFLTLDSQSRDYINKELKLTIGRKGSKNRCDAQDYLELLDTLKKQFQQEKFPVHSFPELSLAAYDLNKGKTSRQPNNPDVTLQSEDMANRLEEGISDSIKSEPYSIDNIISEGCFIKREKLENMLECLRSKNNLILQGPPGTGKTWLAKKLAFACIGRRDKKYLRVVQFHSTMSYEDFVRGWRPTGEGKLDLCDGPFLELIQVAKNNPNQGYVMVIEEINRGNPAQIFGELLTLLERDKRCEDEALQLCHQKDGESFSLYIPSNVYLIGTMNIADRSLALVDFALRRRFGFVTLEPTFGPEWRKWMADTAGLTPDFIELVASKMQDLNSAIAKDTTLGKQYAIGHSYVTASHRIENKPSDWFLTIIETELAPLLREYWFDASDKVKKCLKDLKAGL